MAYNLSFMNETNTLFGVVQAVDTQSFGLFGNFLLLSMFIIIFAMFKNYDTKAVFLADSFIVTFMAILLWGTGILSWSGLIIPIVLLVASLIYQIWGGD